MKIKNIKEKLITCAAVIVIVVIMYLFKIPCPFKAIFSIPCPGCGMTRAYMSLLSFDLLGAVRYNAMLWSPPLLLLFYFFDGRIFKIKWMNILSLTLIFAGFFICWIIKLIYHFV